MLPLSYFVIPVVVFGGLVNALGDLSGRTICPDLECLLAYVPDPHPVQGDFEYYVCEALGKELALKGCPYNCVAEPTPAEQSGCVGGWALYGPPGSEGCISCSPGCPEEGGPPLCT